MRCTLSFESMMLVKQCRYLELQYSTNFTSEVLSHSVDSMRSLKKRVIQADQSLLLDKAKEHPSQSLVAHAASSVGWMKIWDMALDHGPGGTTALLSILKLIYKPVFSDRVCPMVECNYRIAPNFRGTQFSRIGNVSRKKFR